ncbi:epoxide hydrolase family protein, partial [Glycomyces tarimensis]
MSNEHSIKRFTVDIPEAELKELDERLARARFTDQIPGAETTYGVSVDRVKHLVEYWRDGFDWRAWEARLNAHPQFTTEIDGQNIHFLHVRSEREDAFPLLLTHGWPGSVVEFLNVIEPLTAAGFHLVIPSIPGFGFSGPTTETGWDNARIARAWAELMARLGYTRYGAAGNDAGSMISPEVGRVDPEHVAGVHVTQVFSFPSGDPAEFENLTEDDHRTLETLNWFMQHKFAFNLLQAQQPQTLAHALADSPVGLLGWNAQLMDEDVDDDFVLANVAIYWFTGTAGSSIRLYFENDKAEAPTGQTTVPLALAGSKGDFHGVRSFAERDHADVRSWNVYEDKSHYLHYVAPEKLAA